MLFLGSNPRAISEHSHPVIQLVIAIENFFLSKNEKGNWEKKKGLLIAPNYSHECDATQVPILTVAIDPEALIGEQVLNNQLSEISILEYPSEELGQIDTDKLVNSLNAGDLAVVRRMIEDAFRYQPTTKSIKKDERILRVVKFIQSNINTNLNTEVLMDVAHLSESRLLHLFKTEFGLPIRNYILWYRLQVALKLVIVGQSLTEAAHEAGFSDQAHMTRTSVKMIGIPPSTLIKNSKFIQVSFPE